MNTTIEIHSTRLKKTVETIENLTGIAARCDIVIIHNKILRPKPKPKTIFVSMFQEEAFRLLIEDVLPTLTSPTTVILASEDITFPLGIGDKRPRMQRSYTKAHAKSLINSPFITRIFVENLDVFRSVTGKLYPLPLGILPGSIAEIVTSVDFSASNRIHKCFFCHRVRSGKGQWAERARVKQRCEEDWVELTDVFENVAEDEFLDLLSGYNFTICVHGGGIDPSPRAWEAIMRGSIPIIRDSPVADAYRMLPVVIVPTFDDIGAITIEKMDTWLEKFRGWYENPRLRKKVIERLSADWWWKRIISN